MVLGAVSIPYWLGSKLRGGHHFSWSAQWGAGFQSPIGWGLSCETTEDRRELYRRLSFNPLLVGV